MLWQILLALFVAIGTALLVRNRRSGSKAAYDWEPATVADRTAGSAGAAQPQRHVLVSDPHELQHPEGAAEAVPPERVFSEPSERKRPWLAQAEPARTAPPTAAHSAPSQIASSPASSPALPPTLAPAVATKAIATDRESKADQIKPSWTPNSTKREYTKCACGVSVQIELVNDHLTICPAEKRACIAGCGAMLLHTDVGSHLAVCPLSLTSCPLCLPPDINVPRWPSGWAPSTAPVRDKPTPVFVTRAAFPAHYREHIARIDSAVFQQRSSPDPCPPVVSPFVVYGPVSGQARLRMKLAQASQRLGLDEYKELKAPAETEAVACDAGVSVAVLAPASQPSDDQMPLPPSTTTTTTTTTSATASFSVLCVPKLAAPLCIESCPVSIEFQPNSHPAMIAVCPDCGERVLGVQQSQTETETKDERKTDAAAPSPVSPTAGFPKPTDPVTAALYALIDSTAAVRQVMAETAAQTNAVMAAPAPVFHRALSVPPSDVASAASASGSASASASAGQTETKTSSETKEIKETKESKESKGSKESKKGKKSNRNFEPVREIIRDGLSPLPALPRLRFLHQCLSKDRVPVSSVPAAGFAIEDSRSVQAIHFIRDQIAQGSDRDLSSVVLSIDLSGDGPAALPLPLCTLPAPVSDCTSGSVLASASSTVSGVADAAHGKLEDGHSDHARSHQALVPTTAAATGSETAGQSDSKIKTATESTRESGSECLVAVKIAAVWPRLPSPTWLELKHVNPIQPFTSYQSLLRPSCFTYLTSLAAFRDCSLRLRSHWAVNMSPALSVTYGPASSNPFPVIECLLLDGATLDSNLGPNGLPLFDGVQPCAPWPAWCRRTVYTNRIHHIPASVDELASRVFISFAAPALDAYFIPDLAKMIMAYLVVKPVAGAHHRAAGSSLAAPREPVKRIPRFGGFPDVRVAPARWGPDRTWTGRARNWF